jgi:pimeloyl-ACP methyl ester carboxylesterase
MATAGANVNSHRPSRSRFLTIRGLRYHLREWGPADAPPERRVFMFHGWMDVSASFQFIVDALDPALHVIAPDWRGFGLTERSHADCYWFPDYVADLEFILDAVQGEAPAHLVGHSMGGNVVLLYAGARPERVRSLVNLEGFGLHATDPSHAPQRFAQWLDELKAGGSLRDYASRDDVAARLQRNNPRLSPERAAFLAQHWAEPDGAGRFRVAGDPAHRIVNPMLYRLDEASACWKAVASPALMVLGAETDALRHVARDPGKAWAEVQRRMGLVVGAEHAVIANAGHMLHHDQPDEVARLIGDFLRRQG